MRISMKEAVALGVVKQGNKYGAARTEYNGVVYDSKAEATRAMELDGLKTKTCIDGGIDWWIRQVPIVLVGIKFRVDFLVCSYIPDEGFEVHAEEVKGVEGERFRVIKQLWKQHGPFPLHVLKRAGNGWNREVITP